MKQIPQHILTAVCGLLEPYEPGLSPTELVKRLRNSSASVPVDGRLSMRPNEVAEKLGVTPAHIFNMLARGELPRVKLGAVTMIPIEAVRDLLQGREVKAKRRAVREVAHGG